MQLRNSLIGAILLFVAAGCKEESDAISPAPASVPATAETRSRSETLPEEASLPPAPTKPQPKLPTIPLFIGTNELTVEIARSNPEIATGMMWRTNLAEMEGMLFIFPRPASRSFWMRNTLLPLSCAYIDPQGIILELHDMKPRDLTSIPSASDQVQYVLEVNQGWFKRHNITPGMSVSTAHGSLTKTFFRR